MKGYLDSTRIVLLTMTAAMVFFAVGFIWNSCEKDSLARENATLKQQLSQAKDNAGKPIVVEDLPDGDYVRLDDVSAISDKYIFLRNQRGGYETVVGIFSGWTVPKRFAWKDGRFIDFDE